MEARNFNLPRSQEFDSETIGDIELINDATSDQDSVEATTKALEQKIKLNEGGKVFPVGGNVARKVHRNDNPHLDRLHPPQMEELVAQKQIMPPPNLHQLANQELVDISFTELTAQTDNLFVARIKLRTLVPTEVVYKITAKNDDGSRDRSVTARPSSGIIERNDSIDVKIFIRGFLSGLIKVLVFEVPYEEFKAQKISIDDIRLVEDVWNFTSDCADHIESYLFRFNTINPSSPILKQGLSSSSKEPLKEKSLNNKSNEVSHGRSTSNYVEKEAVATASLAEKEVKNLKPINCSTSDADLKNEMHLANSLKETNAEKDTLIEGLERSNVKVKSELEKTKPGIQPLENPVPIAEPPKDMNEAISPDEMLSAASEIIKERNDQIEKLEQELSELRMGQQMGVAQAVQALLFMFSLYVALYFCDYFARFE